MTKCSEKTKKPISKKWRIILPIFLVCVIIVAITITLILFLRSMKPNPEKMAKEALDRALDLSLATDQIKEPEILTIMEEKNGYEIISIDEKEEVVAKIKVYAPDLYSLAQKMSEYRWDDEAQMEKEIIAQLEKEKIVEKEVQLVFIKGEKEYQPILTSDFVDAYYGGALRLKEEYLLKIMEEIKND